MKRNAVSGMMLISMFMGMLTLAFNIQQVEAGGVHTFPDNIYGEIAGESVQTGDPTTGDSWPMFGYDLRHTRFSPSSAPQKPNILWKYTPLPGDLYKDCIRSSPAIVDGRVFVGAAGPGMGAVCDVFCLNETDGTLLWNYRTDGRVHLSSPAVSGGRVFIGSEKIIEPDQGLWSVHCLNATDGVLIWNYTTDGRVHGSSPTVVNDRVFICSGQGGLYCLNATNGAYVWRYRVSGETYSSPAVVSGKVFAGGTGNYGVYCLNETTGTSVWNYTGCSVHSSSPAVFDGRVFIGSVDHHVYCLSESDGTQIWNYTASSWVGSSPAVGYGKVFIASEDGNVYCLSETTGDPMWTYPASYQILSSPAVADGMVFIDGGHGHGLGLIALNETTGTLVWNYSVGTPSGSSPAVANGKVFIGFSEGVFCVGSPFSLTISPTFRDNIGSAFDPPISSWSILFPNNTVVTVSSSSITYPQVQTGNYSIISIIWQGTEVVPEIPPSIFVASDTVWIPSIKCRLPTHLTITLSTSTSYIGFKVDISGRLVDYENTSLAGAMILMEYSVTGGEPWSVITADYTKADGSYSVVWMPSATGNYLVRATWSGNATYPRINATVNLAVIPFKEQYVFSVESNSTISGLAFNTTNWALSFTATGPNGTRGYVKVTVAKNLVANITSIRVYLDGNQTEYSIASLDDSWLLTFNYIHSTHQVSVDLDINIIPEFSSFLILALFMTATLLAVTVYRRKHSR